MDTLLHQVHPRERPGLDEDADALLMARAPQDPQAFTILYERYFDVLYRYCYVRLGTTERAEDATQHIFVRVLEAAERYQEVGHFRAWLFTIARRVVVKDLSVRSPRTPGELDDDISDPAASPEADALAAVERQSLHAALAHLPPDQRHAVELRLAGLTGREIARELGRSHEAVKMLQQRALTRLRVALGPPLRHLDTPYER